MTAFSIILLKIAIDSFTFCRKYQGLFFTVLSSKVKRYWQIKFDKIKFKVTHTFLKNYMRIATRYDKLSISFSAFVSLAVYLISR